MTTPDHDFRPGDRVRAHCPLLRTTSVSWFCDNSHHVPDDWMPPRVVARVVEVSDRGYLTVKVRGGQVFTWGESHFEFLHRGSQAPPHLTFRDETERASESVTVTKGSQT